MTIHLFQTHTYVMKAWEYGLDTQKHYRDCLQREAAAHTLERER